MQYLSTDMDDKRKALDHVHCRGEVSGLTGPAVLYRQASLQALFDGALNNAIMLYNTILHCSRRM